MDRTPDATQPDHTEVQDDVPTLSRPRHPRAFAPLCAHNLAGGLGDARADRKALAPAMAIPHPMRTLFQGGIGLIIALGLTPQAMLTPHSRCRLSHPRDAIGLRFHGLAHLFRPCPTLGRRAKQGIRQLCDGEAGMRVVDDPYPRKVAPGALGIDHLLQHAVVVVTGMVAIIADRDQAQALSVDLAQDVLEQSGQLGRERRLPRLWHLAQIHRADALATAMQYRDGRGRSFLPFPVAHGHIDAISAHGEGRLKPAVGRPGLMQPADDAIDLGRLAGWSHACTETRQEFAERGKYLYIIIFTHSGTDHDICGANAYFPVGKISI